MCDYICNQMIHTTEIEESVSNSSYDVSITLMPGTR